MHPASAERAAARKLALRLMQRPLAVEKEVLIHDEERLDLHRVFELRHHVEQLVAGVVEVDKLALAAEHGRGGAEVAPQGTADRRDDRRGDLARLVVDGDAQVARADPRIDLRQRRNDLTRRIVDRLRREKVEARYPQWMTRLREQYQLSIDWALWEQLHPADKESNDRKKEPSP